MKQPRKLSDVMRDLAQQPIRDEKSGEVNIIAVLYNRKKSNDNERK